MKEKKEKFPLWIYPRTMRMIERNMALSSCRSKSEYIERAIEFYSGYLSANDYSMYFPNVITSTLKGILNTMENRMAAIMFKFAVEQSMTNHMLAKAYRIGDQDMVNLQQLCLYQVKRINGTLSLSDAMAFRRDREEKYWEE